MLARFIVNAIVLLLLPYLHIGIEVSGIGAALVAALVLGLVNALIRPIVLLLTLPLNILTLGLFTFVVNALMFWLVSAVVKGFNVAGFGSALLGTILLSVISGILTRIIR
ncbi:MAG: phage holin family protein [Candidatus Carbobacillus sp.]|nr:phage holin family protein [Candidatus Carbobacillus sp.]